ncbi:MAG: glutamine-hydrolyzing carbamoyl-phosphate synthase small subunit [Nitrospinota bacterium]
MNAILALEDGKIFEGKSFGAEGETEGEAVFNTGMSGYQEILTDPSYHRQIVIMTAPLIGNTGVNAEDEESANVRVSGFVVREPSRIASNFRSEKSLDGYLKENGIVSICGVDTRALTRHIRSGGSMRCVISTKIQNRDELIKKAQNVTQAKGYDMVAEVTSPDKFSFTDSLWTLGKGIRVIEPHKAKYHVAALDLGIKRNILRHLVERGCRVTVFPANATPEEILSEQPDGLFLSNGPGDPDGVPYVKETVKKLVGRLPIFGICLGHQILCLSLGAKTYKMKFGHRGINHPVMDMPGGKVVRITSQNHGFAVDAESMPDDLELTHHSLNDGSVEGMRHKKHPVFSVQYHPEASPGPQDCSGHFDQFVLHMRENKDRNS